mmetsp:Transcript_46662/g.125914  ORF Transcript_46662/g.125914 Transcript_46662/m.125914 type:complete len:213 (-) Transcript_46662:899-1537(-)
MYPIGGFLAASLASFSRDTSAANMGADADVPPMGSTCPPIITWYPSPSAETSGVARPPGGKEPLGGRPGAVLRYSSTTAAWDRNAGHMSEKPPPLPNWSVAISGADTSCCTKRVAPTAVTHGLLAGQEGHILGGTGLTAPPEADPFAGSVPLTSSKSKHCPRAGGTTLDDLAPAWRLLPVTSANTVQLHCAATSALPPLSLEHVRETPWPCP